MLVVKSLLRLKITLYFNILFNITLNLVLLKNEFYSIDLNNLFLNEMGVLKSH